MLVVDAAGLPCAALVPGRGPVLVPEDYDESAIAALCRRHSVERAVLVDEGAIEELTERAAQRLSLSGDYAGQWLTLLAAARELEDEGKLRYYPPRTRLPLPTTAMLRRVLELLLPEDHVRAGRALGRRRGCGPRSRCTGAATRSIASSARSCCSTGRAR